ncbi:MAG: ferrous iron transport protein A, partial [Calditrichaeota bacterium]
MTLADLSKGQKGKIVSLELTGLERRRLMDLG